MTTPGLWLGVGGVLETGLTFALFQRLDPFASSLSPSWESVSSVVKGGQVALPCWVPRSVGTLQ